MAFLSGADGVRYGSWLSFDEPWEPYGNDAPSTGISLPAAPAAALAAAGHPLPGVVAFPLDVTDGVAK